MKSTQRFPRNFEEVLSGFLLVLLTVLLFVQIINRYVFSVSFVWIEEISRISFVWLVYFSAAGAARDDRHIRVEIADLFLSPGGVRALTLFADTLVIAFNLTVVWLGVLLVRSSIEYGDHSPVTEIPMGFIYAVVPVCYALMAYRLVRFHMNGRDAAAPHPPPVE